MIAVSVFLLAGMLAWVGIPLSSSADTAQYFYDPLGRLVGVVDGQGNIATYNYDAVGNLLSISRGAVTAPTVTAVSPSTIEAGRTITMTLTGTGFLGSSVSFPNPDVIPSNLTVTDTTITMNVFVRNPTTFGQNVVTVRNLGGEASGTFGLTQPQLVITSVSPREGEPGAVVVITGTGFGMKLGSNDVAFSGAGNARIAGVVLSYGFTRVTVQAPVAITRGPLTVEVGGVVSNAVTFTGPPILSAISTTAGQGLPENPAAASANLAQTVQLFGAGFWTNTRVRFSATSPTGVSETAFGSLFNVSQDGTSASVSV